jgi:hypothetical protein
MHRNYMKRESTIPGSARASRAMPVRLGLSAPSPKHALFHVRRIKSKSSPWRGSHGQHARRVRSPESPWSVVGGQRSEEPNE